MKFFKYFYNFIRLIVNINRINIDEFINYKVNSNISKKAKLLGSFNISDSTIGEYTYVSQNARISKTKIGKFCSIGPNLLSGWGIHPTNGISTSPMFYSTKKQNGFTLSKTDLIEERKEIIIGNDVFIGANVVILDGVKIGDGAIIGAGSVVSKNIPPYAIAVGCPINIVRFRFNEEQINKLLLVKWWNSNEKTIECVASNFFNINEFIEKEIRKIVPNE